ncbi:MAG: CRISPR-associated endonuclease Cas2 [Treponemataceae bacterium]
MTYFICYDISDSKNRTTVAKTLEYFGMRVQYSIFQCELDCDTMNVLFEELCNFIDPSCDSLHIYPICKSCLKNKRVLGSEKVNNDGGFCIL